jgi:general stress protein 26
MSCFDSSTSSYVTVLGTAALVNDPAVKRAHWKADWDAIYPKGPASADVLLVRLTPSRLEISSESRGMKNDPKTWLPLSIEFPGK